MNVLEKATRILKRPVCDHCFGRQFAQLLHGYSNDERGSNLRTIVASSIDKEKNETDMDMSNFAGYKFHNLESSTKKREKCIVCNDLFLKLDKWAVKIENASKKYEFTKFLIGTKLTSDLIEKEEDLWEDVGIDYCEPLKVLAIDEAGRKFSLS